MLNDAPLAERTISDVETLKALSDPVRLRILETMVSAADEVWTVKRLAAALGVGPTKLYHHVGVLEERDLIRVAGTRVVSGIIETSYRIAQLSLRLDRRLLTGPDAASDSVDEVVATLFDSARADVARGLRDGTIGVGEDESAPDHGLLARGVMRLPPDRAVAFRARLKALFEEFDPTAGPADPAAGAAYGFLVAFYPQPELDAESPEVTE
jgi:DNA-binding transcriptional ArsR family regulator